MKLPGIVTNVTNFGAFVDIGVHQDGLVHVSHLSDQFVDDPNKIVKVAQQVMVTVMEVDVRRKRISLSMKGQGNSPAAKPAAKQATPKIKTGGNALPETPAKKAKPENDWQSQLDALKNKFK